MKKLSGITEQFTTPEDILSQLRIVKFRSTNFISPDPHQLANLINDRFPLPPSNLQQNVDEDTPNFQVTEFQVFQSLSTLNSSKSMKPAGIHGWVVKASGDILA